MKAKRNRKPAKRRRTTSGANAADQIGPTEETRRNLTADPLGWMVAQGMVDSAGERAADEIKCVWLAVCRDVIGKTLRVDKAPARGRFEISDHLDRAHADRYLPWSRALKRDVFGAVLDLVVDRIAPEDPDMFREIAEALRDYARLFDGGVSDAKKKIIDRFVSIEYTDFQAARSVP